MNYYIEGNTVFTSIPNYENKDMYICESWVYLNWNGIIVTRYIISNYGRLFDLDFNKFVQYSSDKDGYYCASIKITHNNIGYKKIRVHRFELLSFYYVSNFKELVVNHKDGIKTNLFIGNLEWSTPIQNTRHGWDNGLNLNIGSKNGNGKFSDAFINQLCSYIDNGYSNIEICNILNLTNVKDRMRMSATITGIRSGKTHANISCMYNFMNGQNLSKRYDLDFAYLICNALSDSIAYSIEDLMRVFNIPEEEKFIFKLFVSDLLRGRTCKSVASQFILSEPKNL